MPWTRGKAKGKRAQLEALSATMTDEVAAAVPMWAEAWAVGVDYAVGDRREFGGELYKCLQPHTSQAGWEPNVAPSLWAKVLPGQDGTEIGEWVQPDSTNGYAKGDWVTHNGKTWESDCDNNVWEPGTTGAPWHEVTA